MSRLRMHTWLCWAAHLASEPLDWAEVWPYTFAFTITKEITMNIIGRFVYFALGFATAAVLITQLIK